jgi:hypothetical protein
METTPHQSPFNPPRLIGTVSPEIYYRKNVGREIMKREISIETS